MGPKRRRSLLAGRYRRYLSLASPGAARPPFALCGKQPVINHELIVCGQLGQSSIIVRDELEAVGDCPSESLSAIAAS